MLDYILVMAGGALGTGARFWLSGFVAERGGELFPLGTLIVNVTGSFAIGFLAAFTDPEGSYLVSPRLRQFFMIGMCGGYTTFSSFSLQTLGSRSGWGLVQGRSEYTALVCLLPYCGMAWTHSCSLNVAEIKTRYASS
jgi:fluoride exporter